MAEEILKVSVQTTTEVADAKKGSTRIIETCQATKEQEENYLPLSTVGMTLVPVNVEVTTDDTSSEADAALWHCQ